MKLALILILIGILAFGILRYLRPVILKKISLPDKWDKTLTVAICILFPASLFFIFYFLFLGMISWLPASTAETVWVSDFILMISFGIAGECLFPTKKKANPSLLCFFIGYALLCLWVIGNTVGTA